MTQLKHMHIIKLTSILILFLTTLLQATQGFGDYLMKDNDYPNAIYAYKQQLFDLPANSPQRFEIMYKLSKALIAAKRLEEAYTSLDKIIENGNTEIALKAQYLMAKQYYQTGFYKLANLEYEDIYQQHHKSKALYLSGWVAIASEDYQHAITTFRKVSGLANSKYSYPASLLTEQLEESYRLLPQKSPKVAGIMSYIIPGSGQMYAKNYKDGFVSFFINALTISLLVNSINENSTGEALIWATLESGWYFGGVYSAQNSAYQYNQTINNNYQQLLKEEYNPDSLF